MDNLPDITYGEFFGIKNIKYLNNDYSKELVNRTFSYYEQFYPIIPPDIYLKSDLKTINDMKRQERLIFLELEVSETYDKYWDGRYAINGIWNGAPLYKHIDFENKYIFRIPFRDPLLEENKKGLMIWCIGDISEINENTYFNELRGQDTHHFAYIIKNSIHYIQLMDFLIVLRLGIK